MIQLSDIFKYSLTPEDLDFCQHHADLMAAGFSLYSFREDKQQGNSAYFRGKVGELATYRWLEHNNIKIIHTPFREEYKKRNPKDDFIVEIDNQQIQIEARCKGRNVYVLPDYVCCTDMIKASLLYIFTSYNAKKQVVEVLGYADWNILKQHAYESPKGTQNSVYTQRTDEFNILIKHLEPLDKFKLLN